MAPIVVLGVGLSLALAALVLANPVWAAVGVAAVGGGVGLLRLFRSRSLWQSACTALLVGYLVLARGFAYTGVRLGGQNIYVGEIVLLLALIMISHGRTLERFARTGAMRLLVVWLLFGVGLLLVSLKTYGLVAIRDAASCYYALYLYVGFAFAERREDARKLLGVVGVALLLIVPYTMAFHLGHLGDVSPYAPGSDYPLFDFRTDVIAAELAAGVLFALLMASHYGWPVWFRMVGGTLQLAMLIIVQVRAAYLGFLASLIALTPMVGLRRLVRPLVLMMALLVVLWFPLSATGILEPWNSTPGRLVEEVLSIADIQWSGQYRYEGSENSAGNNVWRLMFWKLMINQNLTSVPSFLLGQGYGAMVHEEMFSQNEDRPNRNPHNFMVSSFFRTGIIGVLLWLALQATVYVRIFRGIRRARAAGEAWTADALMYIAGHACVIAGTAMLGVVLESPFGAIPYYFLLGLGVRLAEPPVPEPIRA